MKALLAPFAAVVLNVTDGDTIKVRVPAWSATPFETISLRVIGIDTPESRRPPARCQAEVAKGIAAKAFARDHLKLGTAVSFTFQGFDKYGGRILSRLDLPDGRDFALTMIAAGHARAYDGRKKESWCAD